MTKRTAKMIGLVVCVLLILLAVFSPKTSYVKYNRSVINGMQQAHTLDFKFHKDIPGLVLYKDFWKNGKLVSSEAFLQGSPVGIESITIRETTEIKYPEKLTLDLNATVQSEAEALTSLDFGKNVIFNPSGKWNDVIGREENRKIFLKPNQSYILYMYTVSTGDSSFSYSAPIELTKQWQEYWKEDVGNSYVVIRLDTFATEEEAIKAVEELRKNEQEPPTTFTNLMGFDGEIVYNVEGVSESHTYETIIDGERVIIAESFGNGGKGDTIVDLDGDGITELVANVQFSGDGAARAYVYQLRDDGIYLGRPAVDKLNLHNFDDWGANATWSAYNAEQGAFFIHYAQTVSDEYVSKAFLFETDKFDFEPYLLFE